MEFAIKENLDCVEKCRVLAVETALATLTAFYANGESKDSKRFLDLVDFLNKNGKFIVKKLKYKNQILLWSFWNCTAVHKIYSKLSGISKRIK